MLCTQGTIHWCTLCSVHTQLYTGVHRVVYTRSQGIMKLSADEWMDETALFFWPKDKMSEIIVCQLFLENSCNIYLKTKKYIRLCSFKNKFVKLVINLNLLFFLRKKICKRCRKEGGDMGNINLQIFDIQ